MAENKTQATTVAATDFLAGVEPEKKRADAQQLDRIFQSVTGWNPTMWGPSIIGYGQYHFQYDSGREGDTLATGFSPRKSNFALYIMPGFQELQSHLDRLGKYKLGKSCLYINKLADVDQDVLAKIIRIGLDDLATRWSVNPS